MNVKLRLMYIYKNSLESPHRTLRDFITFIQSTWHWTLFWCVSNSVRGC